MARRWSSGNSDVDVSKELVRVLRHGKYNLNMDSGEFQSCKLNKKLFVMVNFWLIIRFLQQCNSAFWTCVCQTKHDPYNIEIFCYIN